MLCAPRAFPQADTPARRTLRLIFRPRIPPSIEFSGGYRMLLNRCINDLNHHRRDIGPNPVAFKIRNDGLLGCLDRTIGLDDDSVSAGDLGVLLRHNDSTI